MSEWRPGPLFLSRGFDPASIQAQLLYIKFYFCLIPNFVFNATSIVSTYIYKEELKTVVCELLACTQPNRHKTFTVFWNTYRRVSLRERRAQIDFSREVRDENPGNDCPPFWFYGESIRTSVFNNTATTQPFICRRWAASAS